MLSGAPPFDGDSSAKIIAQQLTVVPPDIRDTPTRRDARSSPWCSGACSTRIPARRFQTATEVSRALVEALPTAARNRVQPSRHRMLSLALKWLVGLGVAGCLAGIAFVAGAVGGVLVRAERAGVGDGRGRRPGHAGALAGGDGGWSRRATRSSSRFGPATGAIPSCSSSSQHRVAVLTPGRARGYARDSVAYTFDMNWKGGPSASYTLILQGGRRDTVYPEMTLRGAWALARPVGLLLPEDSVGQRVRMSPARPGTASVRLAPERGGTRRDAVGTEDVLLRPAARERADEPDAVGVTEPEPETEHQHPAMQRAVGIQPGEQHETPGTRQHRAGLDGIPHRSPMTSPPLARTGRANRPAGEP